MGWWARLKAWYGGGWLASDAGLARFQGMTDRELRIHRHNAALQVGIIYLTHQGFIARLRHGKHRCGSHNPR